MALDDAVELVADVCASAISPANDASASPMKKALNKFMLAFVFRTSRHVQPHQCSLKNGAHSLRRASCMTRPGSLSAVLELRCAGPARAVDTAEDFTVRFHTVADDTALAVRANRRQRVDGALEAVESVALSAHDHFKRLVIIIFANFAFRHTQFVRARRGEWRCLFSDLSDY